MNMDMDMQYEGEIGVITRSHVGVWHDIFCYLDQTMLFTSEHLIWTEAVLNGEPKMLWHTVTLNKMMAKIYKKQ